jgi:hypothetical protein
VIRQVRNAKADISAGKKVRYKMPELDRAGTSYLVALEALQSATDELAQYYGKLEHQKDNCAKTDGIDKKIRAAFHDFRRADGAIRAEIDRSQLGLQERMVKSR